MNITSIEKGNLHQPAKTWQRWFNDVAFEATIKSDEPLVMYISRGFFYAPITYGGIHEKTFISSKI